jgi:ring-1,2-phenylacetyl-CoA epoxidase subunit PaaC
MQEAIDALWRFTDELFDVTEADQEMISKGIGVNTPSMKEAYYAEVEAQLKEATLAVPERKYFTRGGKKGTHSEHMGFILGDLQYMQRTYPNMKW